TASDPPPAPLAASGPTKPLPNILDRDALLALCGNDPSAALEILEDFRVATRSDIEDLDQCFARKDQASLGRHAHRIKGASAMIGAVDLAQKATRLEALAKQGEWGPVEAAMGQVREAFGSLAEAG
ncbi:MAG: Hpt domain-containing protein, partial [Acidobacteriota bacterium]|nr:Hpt domain-containing protein [Acidobacteriota bacterium]